MTSTMTMQVLKLIVGNVWMCVTHVRMGQFIVKHAMRQRFEGKMGNAFLTVL